MNNLRIKKGDQVKTPHGTGEVKYIYYSSGSCKPFSAQVQVGCDVCKVYFSEMEKVS